MVFTQFAGGDVTLNKENIDPNDSTDWLHRNSSYQHHKFDNESINSNTSYFYYSGLSRSLMFTIRFSKENHDAIFYKFKFYVYIQATTVLSISSV